MKHALHFSPLLISQSSFIELIYISLHACALYIVLLRKGFVWISMVKSKVSLKKISKSMLFLVDMLRNAISLFRLHTGFEYPPW